HAELATASGYQTLYTTFLRQTLPEVDYTCTGTAILDHPPCANAPAPAAVNSGSDPQFIIFESHNGVTSTSIKRNIYAISPLHPATALQPRASGNGWFVSTSYDLNHPENVAAPVTPSVAEGSEALPVAQSLRLAFKDWDGNKWLAERTRDAGGNE